MAGPGGIAPAAFRMPVRPEEGQAQRDDQVIVCGLGERLMGLAAGGRRTS